VYINKKGKLKGGEKSRDSDLVQRVVVAGLDAIELRWISWTSSMEGAWCFKSNNQNQSHSRLDEISN
jgi:hypothetical protein